jgi:ferredoxin-NAD(P)+ reductase (naphthalene dioxygenase ferredoxin-specific)
VSVTVTVADLNQSVPAEEGQTVLDALLAHGVGFPYSCQAGNCGTCRCELVSGDIMELEYSEHALSAEERSRGFVLACRSQVWGDVVVRRLEAEDFIVHPSRVLRCRVANLTPLTHDILLLRMEIVSGGPFTFSAGQFASLEFPVAAGVVRDYSMANCPHESVLEFHIRVMPAESSVSRRVATLLKTGDIVKVSGPLGTSYLRSQHAGPMLCVAGGSGLAPIKSIIETALHDGFVQPLHLYFGVRSERDIYFERELAELQRRFAWFKAHIVLSEPGARSDPPQQPDAQDGAALLPRRLGLVTSAFAEDFASLVGFKVYFAGPPAMVDAASALARERGVQLRDIHADAFFPAANEKKQAASMQ